MATSICVLLLAGIALHHWYLACQIDKHIDKLKRDGFPASVEELNEWYAFPDGENAADVYTRAFAEEIIWSDVEIADMPVLGTTRQLASRNSLFSPAKTILAKKYLNENAETLVLLRKASRITDCRFPIDTTKGPDTPLPHLVQLRDASRMLQLRVLIDIQDAQKAKAVEGVEASFSMARHLQKEPFLISQLVRIACTRISLRSLECVLSRISLDENHIRSIENMLRDIDDPKAMTRGVVGDTVGCGMVLFDTADEWLISKLWQDEKNSRLRKLVYTPCIYGYMFVGCGKRDRLYYLRCMSKAIDISRLPLNERVNSTQSYQQDLFQPRPFASYITGIVLLPWRTAIIVDAQCSMKLSCGRVALAIERFRIANARLPENLEQLIPRYMNKIPTDIFSGQPLLYVKQGDGYTVYSVGKDGVDNKGLEDTTKQKEIASGADYTFIVEREETVGSVH